VVLLLAGLAVVALYLRANAAAFGPAPATLLVVADETDVAALRDLVATRDLFVIKPVDGSGGDRVLVVSGRDGWQSTTVDESPQAPPMAVGP
jgi:glutathione synthase/RimK-type ligase-like ATP-grasp enzyme